MNKKSLPFLLGQGALGIVILIAAFFLLIEDEISSLKNYIALKNVKADLIVVKNTEIDPENDGELIYTNGKLESTIIEDKDFHIKDEAIQLNRIVEVYQWEEETQSKTKKDKEGKKYTEYSYVYKKKWNEKLIDSQNFYSKKYRNPKEKKYPNIKYKTNLVSLGEFDIDTNVIEKLSEPVVIDIEDYFRSLQKYQKIFAQTNPESQIADTNLIKYPKEFKIEGNYFYFGNDIKNPQVGDIRISFESLEPFSISIIGMQDGDNIEEFEYAFKNILIAKKGIIDKKQFLKQEAVEKYKTEIWLAILAFALMYVGFFLVKMPLRKLILMIPYFGVLIAFSSQRRFCLIALLLTTILTGITWLPYLPILSIAMIGLSFSALVIMRNLDYKK